LINGIVPGSHPARACQPLGQSQFGGRFTLCSQGGDAYKHLGALAGAEPMWILIVYVLIVVVGESIVVATGLVLDRVLPLASLPVSLSLFFAVLAFGWPLAVRWTEPKHAKNVKLAS
jgi:hypothetical protein